MKKGKQAKGKRVGLGPRHAPESEARRGQLVVNMQVKRLRNALAKQQELVESYIPPERKVKRKIDPNWVLKGAARPAQEHYQPAQEPDPVPENILETYQGRLSEHPEGRALLQIHLDLAAALHNLAGKSADAIQLLKEGLQMDEADAVGLKYALLRLYLDQADGVEARQIIEEYSEDRSSCFKYSLVLLEVVSHLVLAEEGSSEETISRALQAAMEANPYTAWYLAYPEVFAQAVEQVEAISVAAIGSVEDAFTYCASDLALWEETEKGCGWIRKYLADNQISPPDAVALLTQQEAAASSLPPPPLPLADQKDDEAETKAAEDVEQGADRLMFAQMFNTAIEMRDS